MQLKVRTLSGKIVVMNFEPHQTIAAVKEKLQEKEGVHAAQIKLVYAGRILENAKTVEESRLNPNNQLHMVLNLRGG